LSTCRQGKTSGHQRGHCCYETAHINLRVG
jgi:hypothetical protein